jgi:lipopolysaccharide/colanic/teichoic acid biosynthesis glycosyltransferase
LSPHSTDLVAILSRASKRLFDVVFATAALVAVAPLILVFVLVIRLSSRGSGFYVQPRRGKDGSTFKIYKLRTLDTISCQERSLDSVDHDEQRVFPFGRFLRNRGLDEIPQLFNVVLGDMSIVGPRPHAIPHDAVYIAKIPGYARRYEVRPGVTGWAQVNGSRGRLHSLGDAERRLAFDLYYVDNRSLLLDLRIIMRSVRIVVSGESGAADVNSIGAPLRLEPSNAVDAPKLD